MSENPEPKFYCKNCDYITSNKSDFSRHNLTRKHLNTYTNLQKNAKPHQIYKCDCGNNYKHRQSLYNHKKICEVIADEYFSDENPIALDDNEIAKPLESSKIILELIKQNQEFKTLILEQNNKMIELAKNSSIVNNTTNNTMTHQFNLQFFLNERCKDAVNITDFLNSLKLQVEDFEQTGKLGYVEGISRIFINALKNMDVDKRPIHCTDIKRETLYIKDRDTWEKENVEKNKLKMAVNTIANLNLQQLPHWQELNPDYLTLDTKQNNNAIKYAIAALGSSSSQENEKKINKIMKNVIKEVVIDNM